MLCSVHTGGRAHASKGICEAIVLCLQTPAEFFCLHTPLQRRQRMLEEVHMQMNARAYAEHLQSNVRVRKLVGKVSGKEHEFVQVRCVFVCVCGVCVCVCVMCFCVGSEGRRCRDTHREGRDSDARNQRHV